MSPIYRVMRLEGPGRVERVVCADGSSYEADLVVVGIGGVPATDLAAGAGLACENGIVVDEHCRTSQEHILRRAIAPLTPRRALR
jgi:3-phenylpropionate/trans-cinnamate dioxygenase ferredoxin reductase subunit